MSQVMGDTELPLCSLSLLIKFVFKNSEYSDVTGRPEGLSPYVLASVGLFSQRVTL